MKTTQRRSLAVMIMAWGIAVLLAGCEDSPPGDLSITTEGGTLVLANCDKRMVGPLTISVSQQLERFERTFVGTMAGDWETGGTVSADPLGWTEVEVVGPPQLQPGNRLTIRTSSEDGSQVARFTIPDGGLQPGVWIWADGTAAQHKCASNP